VQGNRFYARGLQKAQIKLLNLVSEHLLQSGGIAAAAAGTAGTAAAAAGGGLPPLVAISVGGGRVGWGRGEDAWECRWWLGRRKRGKQFFLLLFLRSSHHQ